MTALFIVAKSWKKLRYLLVSKWISKSWQSDNGIFIPKKKKPSSHKKTWGKLRCGLFSSVQLLIHVWLFATPWTAARQASLSITNSWSLLRLMSIESVMPSNHLILCHPLLLLSSIFPSFSVFSNESVLRIRWPKYWSFRFRISPSNEHSGLISFRMDWLDLLAVQLGWSGWISLQSKGFSTPQFKNTNSLVLSLLYSPTHIHTWPLEKP